MTSLHDTLDSIEHQSQSAVVISPVSLGDMSRLAVAVYANPVVSLIGQQALAGLNSTAWLSGDWQSCKALLLKYIPVVIVSKSTVKD